MTAAELRAEKEALLVELDDYMRGKSPWLQPGNCPRRLKIDALYERLAEINQQLDLAEVVGRSA